MFLFYNLNNGNEFSDGDIDLEAKLQNLSFLIIFLSFFLIGLRIIYYFYKYYSFSQPNGTDLTTRI